MTVRLAMLSTYTPTQCGIATFCEALTLQLLADGVDVGVVRLVDEAGPHVGPVVHEWVAGGAGPTTGSATSGAAGVAGVVAALDAYDVVVVQHEYGIFPGDDGEGVLDVVARLHVPVITVLHTVLTDPSPNQHRVLAGLVARSAALVVMTQTARDRLLAGWDVHPDLVQVIPHGAADNRPAAPSGDLGPRPTVLTWGLLSDGKGIEWALRALALLRDRTALPVYRVVGQTHPRIVEREGEAYRERLLALVRELGLEDDVEFDGRYLSGPDLRAVVRDADVVLLPYDSLDQVTSGVLTEAVVAGKPVISTGFPHAVELLAGGAGALVPRRDPEALADALEHVLTGDGVAAAMAAEATRRAASLLWPAVARRFLDLAADVGEPVLLGRVLDETRAAPPVPAPAPAHAPGGAPVPHGAPGRLVAR